YVLVVYAKFLAQNLGQIEQIVHIRPTWTTRRCDHLSNVLFNTLVLKALVDKIGRSRLSTTVEIRCHNGLLNSVDIDWNCLSHISSLLSEIELFEHLLTDFVTDAEASTIHDVVVWILVSVSLQDRHHSARTLV